MRKTLPGYFIILLLLPVFFLAAFQTVKEAKQAKSLNEMLDDKINIPHVKLPQTSAIVDHDGTVISNIPGNESRVYVESKNIPLFLKNVFIVSEDRHFYKHPGFDLYAVGRAMAVNFKSHGISQGASTITQQLARNVFLSQQRTYNRKLSEVLYAYQIERSFSKKKILELYLNAIYFQNGAYGIEAASQKYFNKHIQQLTKGEQAFLAAIPNNPTLYDPLRHFQFTKARQERLIDEMKTAGILSQLEAKKIKAEPISLQEKTNIDSFPDYTDFVESEIKQLIIKNGGFEPKIANAKEDELQGINKSINEIYKKLLSSGVIIHTNLDKNVQIRAKEAVQKALPYKDVEGAVAVIRQNDHAIIALIGGKNYQKYNFNRSYQAFRQPGSAIKPLLDYAPYLERTHEKISTKINGAAFCVHGYCPENYGNATYGKVTLENAFIHSYNTPAVRLLKTIGIENAFTDLDKFHFSQVTAKDHDLAAAIGGFTSGMSPLEMTAAYTTFGTDGIYTPAHAIVNVTDRHGKILYTWNDQGKRIWSPETVDKIRYLMKKTVAEGTAKKASIPSGYAGGKTGTTNDYKDYWFIGLTDNLTIGVWVGKDQPESMEYFEKKGPQLLIWRDIARN